MKEKIQQIIISAQLGGLSSNEAAQKVLDLFSVVGRSEQLPSAEEIEKEAKARFKGRNNVKWKAEMFKAGASWMKSVAIGCSDVVGSKNYVGNVR